MYLKNPNSNVAKVLLANSVTDHPNFILVGVFLFFNFNYFGLSLHILYWLARLQVLVT